MLCTLREGHLRDGWRYQNGWTFGKVPKKGGSFSIQKIELQILDLSWVDNNKEVSLPWIQKFVWSKCHYTEYIEFYSFNSYCLCCFPFFFNFLKVSKTMVSAVSYVVITSYYGHDAYCEKCNLILSWLEKSSQNPLNLSRCILAPKCSIFYVNFTTWLLVCSLHRSNLIIMHKVNLNI